MSQAALAEKAEISIPFLSDIERGNKWPYMDTLIRLAAALDIEAYELLKPLEAGSDEMDEAIEKCLDTVSSALRQSIDQTITQTLERIREGYHLEPPSYLK
jgi:transcriptional regulator with XRE-family HTH domain